MFRVLVAIFTIQLSIVGAMAQSRQPANMTTTPPAPTQDLDVLDSTGAWVPIGTVDPSTHKFSGGGGTAYQNHAALLAGVTTQSSPPQPASQQGFYNPGDGGEATYNWNATSLCPGGSFGTPTAPADGLSCVLPVGQSPSTPGRYILSIPSSTINVRQFGLRPDDGTHIDNSPLVGPMMASIGPSSIGPIGPDIMFPPTLGQVYTPYYFSEPFELSRATSLNCGSSANNSGFGAKVELIFPAGIDGVRQENWHLSSNGGSDTNSAIVGCAIGAIGKFGNANTAGNADTGSNVLRNVIPHTPVAWDGAIPLFAPGDGVIAYAPVPIHGAPLLQPGAYVQSVAPGTSGGQDLTLAPPYVIGQQDFLFGSQLSTADAIYRLPASEMYQVQTTAGSSDAIITGGRRPLKVGTWVWSEAFVFGTVIYTENNQVITSPLPTVNSGGSGYGTGSGTMTWNGQGCSTFGTNPVLNVTASGGVITTVTGVANVGQCNGAWPSNTAANWTPGGGLSAGSGATFNLAFANHVGMSAMSASNLTSPALAGKTGTYNLWGMGAGIMRRVGAGTRSAMVESFPIALELYCDQGGGFGTGCASSADYNDVLIDGMIGRFVTGADCAPALSIGNNYSNNVLADIVEACTLSNTYINEEVGSPENSAGRYGILTSCGTENASVFFGGYWSNNTYTDGSCLGNDINGNPNVGVPVQPLDIYAQGSMLTIGAYVPGMAAIGGRGTMAGQWRYFGFQSKTETVGFASAAGSTTIYLSSLFPMASAGMTVTDTTNPTAIPSGTTVVSVSQPATSITISNPLAAPGAVANDQIVFTMTQPPCISEVGGIDLAFIMSTNCSSGVPYDNLTMQFNPSVGAWSLNEALWFASPSVYTGHALTDVVAPNGIMFGSTSSYSVGMERIIEIDPAPFATDTNLEGDLRFNRHPVPGGTLAWSWLPVFTTTFSANVVSGTTTSVAVAACPSPALPAGTPIDSGYFDTRLHVGDLASCTGTTLTLQAPAVSNATSGWQAMFMQNRVAAPIASDAAGTVWPLGSFVTLKPVDLASLPVPCEPGMFASVKNGRASPAYNAVVGTVTGPDNDPVFCRNGVWIYH